MATGWKLHDFEPGEGVRRGAHCPDFDDRGWLDARVPGDVHRTLFEAGLIPDPYYDRNETACAWVQEREWWYRTRLDAPHCVPANGERLRLVCHGLDTLADLWLNGQALGRHANMFRPAVFDVTDRVAARANTLAIRFRPIPRVERDATGFVPWGRHPERVFVRKAQFGFGWDWAPELPGIGIWQPVEVRRERGAVVAGLHFRTLELEPGEARALVAVRLEVDAFDPQVAPEATVRLFPGGARAGRTPVAEEKVRFHDGPGLLGQTVYLELERPRLWWTHDLGTPALYELEVALTHDGRTLDVQRRTVGVRTIALDQAPDPEEPGTRFFRFVLNGVPLFARGANWVPADCFPGGLTTDDYESRLLAAHDAGMNMLRVWGGGIYEHDAFYDACDRLGILVWQDFMFACAAYPDHDPDFVSEVRAEAEHQVRRLRAHPCLALWCGNNENQWIHDLRHAQAPAEPVPGALLYDHVLPAVVAELDGATPYWPGSPFGGDDHNDERQGDAHDWHVWHGLQPHRFGEPQRTEPTPEGVAFTHYLENRSRFVSEFGMHAAPVRETLRRVIPEPERYHHSPALEHHNKDAPLNKGDNLMLPVTGLPRDLDEYVDFSMIAQAEGLKLGIEHFRRRKPHCSGTLVWQLDDCWPGASWSLIDYYGFGKASYFYVRRAYAPVLASFRACADGSLELWLTNDTRHAVADRATVLVGDFAGGIERTEDIALEVAPNTSTIVARWESGRVPADAAHFVAVISERGCFPTNRLFFAAIKDLRREPVRPDAEMTPLDDCTLRVRLRAPGFAYFVSLDAAHDATRFSDNYFDLLPDEERSIFVTNPIEPPTPERLTLRWR